MLSRQRPWREGKLIFDGTPLREVIEEIARHSPVEIIVSDDVPDHPITGLIHIRSTDAMLRFVSSAVPVTPGANIRRDNRAPRKSVELATMNNRYPTVVSIADNRCRMFESRGFSV